MAYTTFKKKSVTKELGTNHLMTQRRSFANSSDTVQFYEMEPAVVLDVIRDENHPIFKDKKKCPKVKEEEWPNGYNDNSHPDYSWIGRIKARAVFSQNKAPMAELSWVLPLETGIKEFPLVNENVVIVKYLNNVYYTRRINSRNFLNNSADFRTEPRYGAGNQLTKTNCPNLVGARNPSNISTSSNAFGQYLGKYFKANNRVRPLKHFEGDTILESRFGSSIRFGCYEDDPNIDVGTNQGNGDDYSGNHGNPMIIIRNRQRVKYGEEGKYSHTIMEDINKDGSSIHITSGKTISKYNPTLSGPPKDGSPPPPQPAGPSTSSFAKTSAKKPSSVKKEPSNFGGLSKVANSSVGTGNIPSTSSVPPSPSRMGDVSAGPMNAMNASGSANTGPTSAAQKASKGDWSGSVGASMGTAVGEKEGKQIGDRLGTMGMANASKIINVEGVSSSNFNTSASIGGSVGSSGVGGSSNIMHSVNSKTGKSKFIKGVGKGNFSLNSTYESGLIGALKKSRSIGKNTLLKKTKAGRAISAANSLGIDIDGVSDLGINKEDSSMFKIFKLASFGLKSICASLKKKKEFGSKTEESLGWLLSFGINLELLALLMSIFNRLRNLKFNFGAMFGFDLDKLTFDLCDWVNQVEFGGSLTDTLTNEVTKFTNPLDPRANVKAVGDDMSAKGILGAFTGNDKDFKQQYTSIISEEEKAQLKAAGSSFGSMGLSLQKDNTQMATMGFDPLTGLFRSKEASPFSSNFNFSNANVASVNIAKDAGAINYNAFGSGISYGDSGDLNDGINNTMNSDQITAVDNQSQVVPTNNSPSTPQTTSSSQQSLSPTQQASPSAPPTGTGSSTQALSAQSTTPTQQSSQSSDIRNSPPTKETTIRPSSVDNTIAKQNNPDTVKSFHTGEEITREQLKGTPLEKADMNAVSLLHPEDFETLTDKNTVNNSIKQANDAKTKSFNKEMAKVEEEATAQAEDNLMFGAQLPELSGNQIIINSERVLISSKSGEMVSFAKGKYGVATDGEMTFNAVHRFVTKTSVHTSVISPTIHLGEYITTRHPVLKGDVAVAWLSSLCGWLSGHVHNDPYITTSSPAQQGQLSGLRARLPTLLSTRVFIDG